LPPVEAGPYLIGLMVVLSCVILPIGWMAFKNKNSLIDLLKKK